MFYRTLVARPEEVIQKAESYFTGASNTPGAYNLIRQEYNQTQADHVKRAAQFLYLNRHGYNGLCRYNQKGKFNVPFGRYEKPYFPKKELVDYVSWVSVNDVTFFCGDVSDALSFTVPGDVVYLDPPFMPLSKTASFTAYDGRTFDFAAQQKLVEGARVAVRRGAVVLVSNHATDEIRCLYMDAREIVEYDAARNISCDGSNRKPARELLAVF